MRGLGKAAKGGGGQQGLRRLVPGSPRPAGWLCRPVPTLLSLPISPGLRSVFSRVSVWFPCLSPSLSLSLLGGSPCLSLSISYSVSFFPPLSLQVGWRRKPTTDLSPTTSPVSSLSPKPRTAPASPPHFVFCGEEPSLPMAPPWPPPPPLSLDTPTLAGFSPLPPASLLSLFCVSFSPFPHPSIRSSGPSHLPGLFFTPFQPLG